MPVRDHIHKFKRHTYNSGNQVYFCILDCTFKIDVRMSVGQNVICNMCGNPFQMDEYTIKLKLPHCRNCGKRKITTTSGETRYIRKEKQQVMPSVAADSADSLLARMRGEDDDI